MAGSSLLALLDDIATLLDDVALLTKVAAKKTSGVLGDDLAVNAEQVAGVKANRELPVVWAVAKGSLRNKGILVPMALLISALAPKLISPLLMAGGAFLCFEAFEKLVHFVQAKRGQHHIVAEVIHSVEASLPLPDPLQQEADKIKGAIRTDFILSAEIITITLGIVAQRPFLTRLLVLLGVGVLMTIGVYGVVGAIVKLDDLGLMLLRRYRRGPLGHLGRALLKTAPVLMKSLGMAGTIAMFLVGGGILAHGIPLIEIWINSTVGKLFGLPTLAHALLGMIAGGVIFLGVQGIKRILRRKSNAR